MLPCGSKAHPSILQRLGQIPGDGGPSVIIPNRHVANDFSVTKEERTSLWAMVDEGKKLLEERFKPKGYSVGINVGSAAGRTITHCHIHLIPRRSGDSANPCGGVCPVIAGKADDSKSK